MSWILVVLQATAPGMVLGWQPIAEFNFKGDCKKAIVQMQTVSAQHDGSGVQDYICIPKLRVN